MRTNASAAGWTDAAGTVNRTTWPAGKADSNTSAALGVCAAGGTIE
jgi:hypothetical protein